MCFWIGKQKICKNSILLVFSVKKCEKWPIWKENILQSACISITKANSITNKSSPTILMCKKIQYFFIHKFQGIWQTKQEEKVKNKIFLKVETNF
jgi:hypothetical protein